MSEYAKLKTFLKSTGKGGDVTVAALRESVHALGDSVKRGRQVGRLALRVTDNRRVRHFCLDLVGGECRVSEARVDDPTFAISCTKETWAQVAGGKISPVDAFYQGMLEVEGDLSFGKRLYANAASKRGSTDLGG